MIATSSPCCENDPSLSDLAYTRESRAACAACQSTGNLRKNRFSMVCKMSRFASSENRLAQLRSEFCFRYSNLFILNKLLDNAVILNFEYGTGTWLSTLLD